MRNVLQRSSGVDIRGLHYVRILRLTRERRQPAEIHRACEHELLANRVIGRVAPQKSREARLRTKSVGGETKIHRVVDSLVRVGSIVPTVLNETSPQNSNAYGLRIKRYKQWIDGQRAHTGTPVGEPVQGSVGFG